MNLRHLVIAGAALAAVSVTAVARENFTVSVGFGVPAPVYAAPAPVYYPPAPAYYPPAPAYYVQAPAYYPPAPAYYPPAYRVAPVAVYAPRVVWYRPAPYINHAHRPQYGYGRAYGGRH